jgi:hypothetical protein
MAYWDGGFETWPIEESTETWPTYKNYMILANYESTEAWPTTKPQNLATYKHLATDKNLANLLYIFNNTFIGCILEELGNCSLLHLFKNKLGGPIPRAEYESTKPLTSSYCDSLNAKG